MSKEEMELISYWVTVIGLPLTIITVLIVVRQFVHSKKIEQAKFWLELRQIFLTHNEVHLNLRNGGKWAENGAGPQTFEEWAKVDAYLGQFELCQSMLEQNLISKDIFESQYKYRLGNILHNQKIIDKINLTAKDWQLFIRLCRSLGYNDI